MQPAFWSVNQMMLQKVGCHIIAPKCNSCGIITKKKGEKRMLGLKRGEVTLLPHNEEWRTEAERLMRILEKVLGSTACDIRHVGSTAVRTIAAKPIIDIAVGVSRLGDVRAFDSELEKNGIIFRGEDIKGQLLYVTGDFENDTRLSHIHIVPYGKEAWKNYISFCEYLNAFPDEAKRYESLKFRLARDFPHDRTAYTQGKEKMVDSLIKKAVKWKYKGGGEI